MTHQTTAYEAWRISYQSSEQAARAAWEELESERRHQPARDAAAVRTLAALGYAWKGGGTWDAPVQKKQEPCTWAISYDGKIPYTLWYEDDGPLLDAEVERQGGTCRKMPLYAAPVLQGLQPLTEADIQRIGCAIPYITEYGGLMRFARAIERAHGIPAP